MWDFASQCPSLQANPGSVDLQGSFGWAIEPDQIRFKSPFTGSRSTKKCEKQTGQKQNKKKRRKKHKKETEGERKRKTWLGAWLGLSVLGDRVWLLFQIVFEFQFEMKYTFQITKNRRKHAHPPTQPRSLECTTQEGYAAVSFVKNRWNSWREEGGIKMLNCSYKCFNVEISSPWISEVNVWTVIRIRMQILKLYHLFQCFICFWKRRNNQGNQHENKLTTNWNVHRYFSISTVTFRGRSWRWEWKAWKSKFVCECLSLNSSELWLKTC